jgi:hypothetical protein
VGGILDTSIPIAASDTVAGFSTMASCGCSF